MKNKFLLLILVIALAIPGVTHSQIVLGLVNGSANGRDLTIRATFQSSYVGQTMTGAFWILKWPVAGGLASPSNFLGFNGFGNADFQFGGVSRSNNCSGSNYIIFESNTAFTASASWVNGATIDLVSFNLGGGSAKSTVSLIDDACSDALMDNKYGAGISSAYFSSDLAMNGNSTVVSFSPASVSNVALPLTLVSFTAAQQGNNNSIKLDWSTVLEVYTDHFSIERSGNGIDFSPIAQIAAAGNSSSLLNYSWVDDSPLSNVNYYRLKLVDIDKRFTYSQVRAVRMSNGASKISVFPTMNTTGTVYIQLAPNMGTAITTLTNSAGQFLSQRISANGINRQASLQGLTSGIYFIHVDDRDHGIKETYRIFYQQ